MCWCIILQKWDFVKWKDDMRLTGGKTGVDILPEHWCELIFLKEEVNIFLELSGMQDLMWCIFVRRYHLVVKMSGRFYCHRNSSPLFLAEKLLLDKMQLVKDFSGLLFVCEETSPRNMPFGSANVLKLHVLLSNTLIKSYINLFPSVYYIIRKKFLPGFYSSNLCSLRKLFLACSLTNFYNDARFFICC
ncbi:hypothetical protein Pfo_021360 [Paulownia fortunei]|nr:hypothetical protein Pfo_021360 [Paulownia fortunei]